MIKLSRTVIVAGAAFLLAGYGAIAPTRADTLDDAKALSQKAAALIDADGEKAFLAIDDPKGAFVQGNLYVVVEDQQGVIRAHYNPKFIGMSVWDQTDPDGVLFTQDAVKLAATTGSGWQSYKFVNPATKKIAPKKAWVEKAGNFVVICGAYVSQ